MFRLESFIGLTLKHAGKLAVFSVFLMLLGAYLAKSIGLDSSLKSLLPKKAWSVQNMDVIQKKSGSSNDLRILVWGSSLEKKIEAADAFGKFLNDRVDYITLYQFRTPKEFLEKHKYTFVRVETLDLILEKLKKERKKNSAVTDPLGLEATIDKEEAEKNPNLTGDAEGNDSAQEDAQLDKAKELLNRLNHMRSTYSSEDGKYLSVRIVPKVEKYDVKASRKLVDQIESLVQEFQFQRFDPEIKTMVYGSIPRNVEKFESIRSDVGFGAWGVLFVILVVIAFFRSFWAPVVLVPPLLSGLALGVGLVNLFERSLNTVAVFLVMVVFGVGIEFGVHLWARFIQERKSHDLRESLTKTWSTTGRATITSAVALLMGFALLTISSFEGFAQFGRVAIVLVSTTAAGFLIFTPAWIVLVERVRKFKAWPVSLADLVFERIRSRPGRWLKSLVVTARAVSIFLLPILVVTNILYLKFDYGFEEKIPTKRELPAEFKQGSVWAERTKPSAVAILPSFEEATKVQDYFDLHSKEYPDVALMSSLSTFYPANQNERLQKLQELADEIDPDLIKKYNDPEIRDALVEIQAKAYDYTTFSLDEVPMELKKAFLPMDGTNESLVQLFDRGGRANGQKAMKFSDGVQKLFSDMKVKPLYSGDEIIFGDIVRRVIAEGPWLILGMFLLVAFICILDFRSFSKALITLSPVVYGFALTGFVIVVSKVNLNFYNMAALASLGAMVVDNSIHLFHRYLEFKEEGGGKDSGRMASYAVVPTVVACTLTSICGYGGMLFANHSGIASLGFVAVAGLLCCLLAAVIFFPSWLISCNAPSDYDPKP